MWIKLTPKKFENERLDARKAVAGILETPEIHVQVSQIATVRFGDELTQIQLSTGGLLDVVAPDEIKQLRQIVASVPAYVAEETLMAVLKK